MDSKQAREAVQNRSNNFGGLGDQWKDARYVATTNWRDGALDQIADPKLLSSGVALVELDLNHPHPYFYAIVRSDDQGVWYADADGNADDPVWRLRLLPWRHIDGMTLHQIS